MVHKSAYAIPKCLGGPSHPKRGSCLVIFLLKIHKLFQKLKPKHFKIKGNEAKAIGGIVLGIPYITSRIMRLRSRLELNKVTPEHASGA